MLALRVVIPFAVGYLVAYIVRVVNAVASTPIRDAFGLSAGDMGLLTSVYFLTFALCQLPFGVLMDRYGPRRVEAAVLVAGALGCVVFALAANFAGLVAGRLLMGVGASLCLMAPFTAYRAWFSPQAMPMVVGLHMAFGGAGAALGGGPTEAVMASLGLPTLFVILAAMTVGTSLLIACVVPRRKETPNPARFGELALAVGAMFKSRPLWRLAPLTASTQAITLSILSLWTGPWLRDVAGLSEPEAALWLSYAALGLTAGFLIYGGLAAWAARSGQTERVFLVGSVLTVAVGAGIVLAPPEVGTRLWVVFSVVSTGGILSYSLLTAAYPASLAGRANTALNFIVFAVAFAVQWGFGVMLDVFAGGAEPGRETYQVALGVLIALQVVSFWPLLTMPRPAPVASGA